MTYINNIEEVDSLEKLESKISDLEVAKKAALKMASAAREYELEIIRKDTEKLEARKAYLERERARELQNFAAAKSSHIAHHLGDPVPKPSPARARAAKDSEEFSRGIVEEARAAAYLATLEDARDKHMKAIPSYFKAAFILENFDPKKAEQYRKRIEYLMQGVLSSDEKVKAKKDMEIIEGDLRSKGLRSREEIEAEVAARKATAEAEARAKKEERAKEEERKARPTPPTRKTSRPRRGRTCGMSCFSRPSRDTSSRRKPKGGGKKKRKRNKTIRKKIVKRTKRVKKTKRVKRTKRR